MKQIHASINLNIFLMQIQKILLSIAVLKKIIIKLVQILIPFYKYFFVKKKIVIFSLFVVCIHRRPAKVNGNTIKVKNKGRRKLDFVTMMIEKEEKERVLSS